MAERTQIAEPKESNEAKSDSTERQATGNPFAAVDLQAGKIERPKDPQADQIIQGDQNSRGLAKAASPVEMADMVSKGKASLDALTKAGGIKSGGPGWDDYVKGLPNNPLDNSEQNNKMTKAIQDAFKVGGKDAVEKLMDDTNSKIEGPFGPKVRFNDDKTATLAIQEQDPKNINKIWDISKPVTFKLEAADKPNPAALGDNKGLFTLEVGDQNLEKASASADSFPNATKQVISTVVAAAALREGEKLVEGGKNIKFFNNFSLEPRTGDGRDAERAYWLTKTADAVGTLDQLPRNAKVEASAQIKGGDIVLRGSIMLKGDWPKDDYGRANRLNVKDENGQLIKDENGQNKFFPSVHKKGFVHENVVPGKPVLEIVRDKENELRSFAIPFPKDKLPGFKQEEYAQSVVDKIWNNPGKAGFIEFPMYEKVEEDRVSGVEGMAWKGGGQISKYEFKKIGGANEKGYISKEEQKIVISRGINVAPELPKATALNEHMLIVHVAKDGRIFDTTDINTKDMKRPDFDKLMIEAEKKIK